MTVKRIESAGQEGVAGISLPALLIKQAHLLDPFLIRPSPFASFDLRVGLCCLQVVPFEKRLLKPDVITSLPAPRPPLIRSSVYSLVLVLYIPYLKHITPLSRTTRRRTLPVTTTTPAVTALTALPALTPMSDTRNATMPPTAPRATEGAPAHGNPAHLLPPSYKRSVAAWLEEDAPSFDYGGFVVGEGAAEARLLGKSEVSACVVRLVASSLNARRAVHMHSSHRTKELRMCGT